MEPQKKYDVFISYSHKDSAIADKICKALDQAGIIYFIDRKGIGGSANYVTKIANEIDSSKLILLLASSNSYNSDYVSIEIHYAFNHNVDILPYALDQTPAPKDLEILLIRANWLYMNQKPITPDLVASIAELLGADNIVVSGPKKRTFKDFIREHKTKLIALIVVLGAIIGSLFIFQQPATTVVQPTEIERLRQDSLTRALQAESDRLARERARLEEEAKKADQQRKAEAASKAQTTASTTTTQVPSATTTASVTTPATATTTPKQTVTKKIDSFAEAKAKADAGDATASYKVAMAYKDAKNLSAAFNYMKAAAEQGYTPAYIEVAKMYHGGRGVQKNRNTAEFWYKKAAEAGNAEARRMLLNM